MTHPTHKSRSSDSSLYDEKCEWCGATDADLPTNDALERLCPKAPPQVISGIRRIGEIDAMFATATGWGSWMRTTSNERKALVNDINRIYGLSLRHNHEFRTEQSTPIAVRPGSLQDEAWTWARQAFGDDAAGDVLLRALRFAEEAAELTQACGLVREDLHRMVDVVYDRPAGTVAQEAGGVRLTLMVLCSAAYVDLEETSISEMARVWAPAMIAKVRARQATKPQPTRPNKFLDVGVRPPHCPLIGCRGTLARNERERLTCDVCRTEVDE